MVNPDFKSPVKFLMKKHFLRIWWFDLMVSPRKSLFLQLAIKLLGVAGSGTGGLRPSLDKVGAIRDYARPEKVYEVERFLNMTTYLRQWIPDRVEYSKVLKNATVWGPGHLGARIPIGLDWNNRHEEVFIHIKRSIKQNVVWEGDPTVQYHLATDASGHAAGGCYFS